MVQFCLKFNGNVQHPPGLTLDQCIASSLTWLIKADIYCALPGASRPLTFPSASSPLPELSLRNKARVGVCSTQSPALLSLAEQLGAASWALCCAGPCCATFQFGPKRLNTEAFKQPWHCLIGVLNVFRHSTFSVTSEDSTKCRAH